MRLLRLPNGHPYIRRFGEFYLYIECNLPLSDLFHVFSSSLLTAHGEIVPHCRTLQTPSAVKLHPSACAASRMRSASSSSPCMTAYSKDAPQKLCFGGEIRQRRTRRVRKHPQASSRLIASIVLVLRSAQREGGSSLCGIAIVSTPSFLLHQWTDPFKISTLHHTIPYAA